MRLTCPPQPRPLPQHRPLPPPPLLQAPPCPLLPLETTMSQPASTAPCVCWPALACELESSKERSVHWKTLMDLMIYFSRTNLRVLPFTLEIRGDELGSCWNQRVWVVWGQQQWADAGVQQHENQVHFHQCESQPDHLLQVFFFLLTNTFCIFVCFLLVFFINFVNWYGLVFCSGKWCWHLSEWLYIVHLI